MTTTETLDALDRTPSPGTRLTARQQQVLRLIAEGHTNDQISSELFVTAPTVATQVQRILRKLDVPTRAAAVHRAWQLGILGGAR